jgi:hypothetical protein
MNLRRDAFPKYFDLKISKNWNNLLKTLENLKQRIKYKWLWQKLFTDIKIGGRDVIVFEQYS